MESPWRKQICPSPLPLVTKSKTPFHRNLGALTLLLITLLIIAIADQFCPLSVRRLLSSIDLRSASAQMACMVAFLSALTLHEWAFRSGVGGAFRNHGRHAGPFRRSRMHARWNFSFVPRNLVIGAISAIPTTTAGGIPAC